MWLGGRTQGSAVAAQGRVEEAVAIFETCAAVSQRHHWVLTELADMHHRLGRLDVARCLLEEVLDRERTAYLPPGTKALALGGLGRIDEAIDAWERAYREHDAIIVWTHWPVLPPAFTTDRRFGDVLRRLGVEPGKQFAKV